jgi:hypothetical protein
MNERFNILPSHDDFAKIVTRPELEDATTIKTNLNDVFFLIW